MKCMHMISRDREYSEGRGVGVNCRQHVVYILNCSWKQSCKAIVF